MPPVIAALPLILGVAGAATGATELGLNLAGVGKPGPPSPYPTTQQTQQQKAQLASTVQQNLGNSQEQGSGGLSPNYEAQVIGSNTGTLDNINLLQDLVTQYGGAGFNGSAPTNFPNLSIPSQSNSSLSGGSGLTENGIFGGP
jgi:hypothetical protein